MITPIANPELEQLVIKCMMKLHDPHNELLIQAFDMLDEQCFQSLNTKIMFKEMFKIHLRNEPISEADLVPVICSINPDLFLFIQNLPDWVTSHSLIHWCTQLRSLKEHRQFLELLGTTYKSTEHALEHEWRDTMETLPQKLLTIRSADPFSNQGLYTARQCVDRARLARKNNQTQKSSGFVDLDEYLQGGFRLGTLIVIGAPPSAGKTEFSTRLVCELSKQMPEKEALIFSLEMREEEITDKLIEHLASKPINRLSELERHNWEEQFARTNIHICDKSPVSIEFIRSACIRSQMRTGISVIVVDFLDKMSKPKGDLRSDEKLTEISSQLKNIAKDFNCIVILLTQINKAAINRPDKRPNMNDSKNSNGAAENADYWLGIKRIGQWDLGKRYPDSHLIEIIIDKNRFGQQGIFYLALNYHLYQEINQDFARQLVEQGNALRKEQLKKDIRKEDKIFSSFMDD